MSSPDDFAKAWYNLAKHGVVFPGENPQPWKFNPTLRAMRKSGLKIDHKLRIPDFEKDFA